MVPRKGGPPTCGQLGTTASSGDFPSGYAAAQQVRHAALVGIACRSTSRRMSTIRSTSSGKITST